MNQTVIIPAYNPDPELLNIMIALKNKGINIIVVDDGSNADYIPVFEKAADFAIVLRNNKNKGKGAALKRGISAIRKYFPETKGFITADADGQHSAEDILRVSEKLKRGAKFVITGRRFYDDTSGFTKTSSKISRVVFTLATGRYLADNQSGLRGFDITHAKWMTKVSGDSFDYEMNVLLYADRKNLKITEIPIKAEYINVGVHSHFRPFTDTIRIYKKIITACRASVYAFLLYELLMMLTQWIFEPGMWPLFMLAYGFISTVFCIVLNKTVVFKNQHFRAGWRILINSVWRYTIYMIMCLVFSMFGIPMLWGFNLTVILSLPFQYLFIKHI